MGADLGRAFVSFFAIIDPVGNVIVFHLLTQGLSFSRRMQVAVAAVLAALVLLAAFSVGGVEVLDILGIDTESFKVAAGLLLLPPAFALVTRGQSMGAEREEAVQPVELALVPLATPLLAGPGALAASISFSQSVGSGTAVLAVTLVLALALAAFLSAEWLFRRLGAPLLRLLARIVGILLFAIAVDFVLEGAKAFFDT